MRVNVVDSLLDCGAHDGVVISSTSLCLHSTLDERIVVLLLDQFRWVLGIEMHHKRSRHGLIIDFIAMSALSIFVVVLIVLVNDLLDSWIMDLIWVLDDNLVFFTKCHVILIKLSEISVLVCLSLAQDWRVFWWNQIEFMAIFILVTCFF